MLRLKILTLLMLVGLPSISPASVPQFISYSGRLTDGTGWGQTQLVDLAFFIYDAETEGVKLWEHGFEGVVVEDGYFAVILDEGTDPVGDPLNLTEVFAVHDQAWITVSIEGGPELSPRQPVGSAPYAVRAGNAAQLGGEGPDHYATAASVSGLSTDLDDNYHTKNELAGGALDGRYYTKTNLEPDTGDAAIVAALGALTARVDQLETDKAALQGQVSTLQTDLTAAEQTIADLEDPDCPLGYDRDETGDNANYIVCKRGADEIVKVGDFWIDRYEVVLVDEAEYNAGTCDGSGTVYGRSDGDAHAAGFVRNGSDITTQLYACSLPNENPSRWVTWFQAQEACGAAGKELCTNAQWQLAAFGTADPSATDPGDDSEVCNIWSNSKPAGAVWGTTNQTVLTGSAAQCISRYGAYDMIGNLWEWTANWYGQGADSDDGSQADDGEFHGDGYWNVDNAQYNGTYNPSNPVFPASALRGGNWFGGSQAGVFALTLGYGPARWYSSLGARCCRR